MRVLTSPIDHSTQSLSEQLGFLHYNPYSQSLHNMTTFSIRAFIPPLTRRCVPLQATRRYAVQAPGAPMLEIFSNQQKWQQKERAASNAELSRSVDYLRDEVASRLCERIMVRRVVRCLLLC
jgi:hypothetical protein